MQVVHSPSSDLLSLVFLQHTQGLLYCTFHYYDNSKLILPPALAFPTLLHPSSWRMCLTECRVFSRGVPRKIVTEDEVKRMKGGGYLFDRLVLVQFTKPPEVIAKTAIVLDKYGYIGVARRLRGW